MSDYPPKKKLCQISLKDMLKPLPHRSSAECESKKKHASSASIDKGNMESSKSHTSENKLSGDSYGAARMDSNTKHKGEDRKEYIREEKKSARPGSHSKDSESGESVKGEGRSADLRNILARAAERRIHSSATPHAKSMSDNGNSDTEEKEWRGMPLSSMPCLTTTNPNVPPVIPSPDHTVLVRLPVTQGSTPHPYPSSYSDAWDQSHVRMPCSPKSQYLKNKDLVVSRWGLITEALSREIKCVDDLESAILEYNSRYASKWKFRGLHLLMEQEFEDEEREYFFDTTLPAMVQLALNLPVLVTQAVPLLQQGSTHSVTLSQLQIACLLANAFFCTFPRRNAKGNDTEYARYPDINFNRLFFHKERQSLEKMKCLLHYFKRVTTKPPTGNVTFTRQTVSYQETPNWVASKRSLPNLHISSTGLIEEATGLLQVDFANKYLGGGVLGLGCVQEEIRFVLCPELIISCLFTQALEKTDALVITGCEQFSCGSGYSSTFCWEGAFQDTTPVDQWGRRLCQVTAIDALHFTKQPNIQYKPTYITRELNKAYAGFKVVEGSPGVSTGVATGNWGCGAFKGNPRLKALIQMAVCGEIGRDLAYFTFGDQKLRDDLFTMYIFLKENNVTVGELTQALHHHGSREWSDGTDLFLYICHSLGSYDSDTDQEASKDSTDTLVECTTDVSETDDAAAHSSDTLQSKRPPVDIGDCFPEPGRIHQRPISEEKMHQALSECDRLFESKKVKKKPGAAPTPDNSLMGCPRRPEKTSQNNNKPSQLFAILDEIDRKVNE